MFFVVQYRRSTRQLVSLTEHLTRSDAFDALAKIEHERTDDVEQVLLSSDSRRTLERTHARYFATADRILATL